VLALIGAAIVMTAAGCGDDPLPSVKFVGNDSCPTSGATQKSPSPPNVNSRPPVGQAVDEMPATHLTPPATAKYLHDPPTSGCHYSLAGQAPVPAGAYDKPIGPEYWVHNLEHGYIVVLYNCPEPPGCSDDFNKLHDWFKSLPADPGGAVGYAKVLILPWSTMKPKFAVVAWDWYDDLGSTLKLDEVQRFYDNHVNQSTEGAAAQ
jgi:hypothetical protein